MQNSFSNERFRTLTCFEAVAEQNSEMAYYVTSANSFLLPVCHTVPHCRFLHNNTALMPSRICHLVVLLKLVAK